MLSTRTTRPLKLLALAVALAGLGVPTAQAKFDPWTHTPVQKSTQSVPLITEHSAGQNGTGQALDPAIAAAIGSHSAAQNGVSRSAAASVSASVSNGFNWRDAGVGVGVAFAAMLLAVGVATVILRRGRGRLAGF